MQRSPFAILAGVVLNVAGAAAQQAAAQQPAAPPPEPPGIAELSSELLAHHAGLLDEQQRQRLDTLNREAREAGERARRAKKPAERQEQAGRRSVAVAGMVELLEQHPGLIKIKLPEAAGMLPVVGPVELPGDAGMLLVRVQVGEGDGVKGLVCPIDFSGLYEDQSSTWNEVLPNGSTFVLVSFKNVPKGPLHYRVEFRASGKTWKLPVNLVTAPPGRLKLTVAGPDGQPVPAMVRLKWLIDGRTRRPAGSVEIADQFDNQGRVSSERFARTFGRQEGEYYAIGGPVDMELPAGGYELTVRRGIEHVPAFDSFTVEAGKTITRTLRPRRWTDMRQLGWYSGDDHVHCRILSDQDAQDLLTYARAEDVHLVNIVKMGDVYRTFFEQRGFGREYRISGGGDYVLCPGQECPRTHEQIGHTISMNIQRMVRDTGRYFLYDWVFDQVHADGGLSGYAHVNVDMFNVRRDMALNIPKGKVDFAEVLQFGRLGTDLWYRFLNSGFRLTASAGSDIPWGGSMGEVRVYAYIGEQPFSADAWFAGMRRGRTFVTNGPMLELNVDGLLPGDQLNVREDRMLRVRARCWGDADAVLPAKLEIIVHGQAVASIEPSRPDQRELVIDTQVPAGCGLWIAARAAGNHGESAHTTPVYVTRDALRFWKHEQAEQLISQGLASLDEIEKLITDATAANEQGKAEEDRYIKLLAEQGPELRQRVEEGRKVWTDLRAVAQREARIRAAASRPVEAPAAPGTTDSK